MYYKCLVGVHVCWGFTSNEYYFLLLLKFTGKKSKCVSWNNMLGINFRIRLYTHPIKSPMFDSNTNRVGEFDFFFDILSLNVRGIRNDTKRNKIFDWLKNHTSNQAVVFLQETHSTSDVENLWSNQWQFKEKIIFSHGEHNARGTLIAFRENLVYS